MKLNIVNYNPDINEDIQYVDELIKMFTNLKDNLRTKCYTPYQKFLTKMNKFINMVSLNFEKELNEVSSKKTIFDESDDSNDSNDSNDLSDDNISIGSISEYEEDEDCSEFEELQIKNFEDITEVKLYESINRFDFEYTKIPCTM
jgi:hypothetical protein